MQVTPKSSSLLARWLQDSAFYAASILKNAKKIKKMGDQKVLKLFFDASQEVPAYKYFLKKHKIKVTLVKTISDFAKIPATTKENYIEKYSLKDRCWDGKLDRIHMISASSGTTGEPHFWPRDLNAEIEGAYIHELIFKDIFTIDKKKTLFVNGFAMGNWIAGTFTLACVNLVAWKNYSITSMTPGYSIEAVIELLEKMSPQFDQTIITGHTPFLKELIESAVKRGINFSKVRVFLLGTGQGITENWRTYMISLTRSLDRSSFLNLYGSADAGLMGFETPLSIFLRKILSEDLIKNKKIFHNERLPSIYNFDPRLTYFEEENKELHISKNSGCPLIRYNIHDEGGVINYEDMISNFDKETFKMISKRKDSFYGWKLPFVYLFGRDKFMVKIYGANIYSEHVQSALNHNTLQEFITGRYHLETDYDENHNPQIICRIEMIMGLKGNRKLENLIQKIFVEEVRKLNSEYNYILEHIGEKVKPKIILHEHGYSVYFPKGKIKKTA